MYTCVEKLIVFVQHIARADLIYSHDIFNCLANWESGYGRQYVMNLCEKSVLLEN